MCVCVCVCVCVCMYVCFEAFEISFIYNRDNIGPKIEPCGTPVFMILQSEAVLCT